MNRISRLPVLLVMVAAGSAMAADWRQFRGPGGLGTSMDTGLPTKWSSEDSIVWKTKLPGPGGSSPVTLGGRIFLTSYSGYGLKPGDGDMKNLMRHVLCLDRKTGKVNWSNEFKPALPESTYSGGNRARHGYSSSTPVTDGERLYVFFGKSGVYCFDLDGKQIWHQEVGDGTHGWGSGASPVIYKDLLIVNASVEARALLALNKMTGKEVWRVENFRGVWNTPLLVTTAKGQTELVASLPRQLAGYDPATGKQLWSCNGIPDRGYVCPSVVAHKDIIYAIGGRQNTAMAVRSGGRGDVTKSHQVWRVGSGSNVSSPVYHDGHIYWFHERRGVAYCLDAATGKTVFEERLTPQPGIMYASTIVADGKLYCVSQYNGTYVVAAEPKFKLLAHNVFQDDKSRVNASMVVSDSQLLMRTDGYMYCIGK